MTLQGIDVSNWKNVDVTKARDFVIVQTTWGTGTITNSNGIVNGVSMIADSQVQRALSAGKRLGFMHYYCGGDVHEEARFFVQNNLGYFGKGIPMIDWEQQDNQFFYSSNVFEQLLLSFSKEMGGTGIVYFQQSEYDKLKPIADACNWGSMVAQYANNYPTQVQENPWNENAYSCAIRQYSSMGDIGAGQYVDLDKFYGDGNAWDAYVANSYHGISGVGSNITSAKTTNTSPQTTSVSNVSHNTRRTYVVQSGDTLSGIAAKLGVPMSQITGYSSGNPNLIYAGETLTIESGLSDNTYVVQSGDTLSGIAAKLGVPMSQITGYSSGNPNLIYAGEILHY